jgi:hypothetical protein
MMSKVVVFSVSACVAAVLACGAAPAGQSWHHGHDDHWRATHAAIYQLENRVAYLEADPAIDDGYKAPVVTQARADVETLRATLHPAHWRWDNPCCYGRRPIRIR